MPEESILLYVLIVGCEVAFWLVLALSLVLRYLLRRQSLSKWLLRSLPLIDLLLLGFTAVDLKSGTTATVAHGLAAAYVGFTVAFDSIVITWADARFAHRLAGGPAPAPWPTRGWGAVRYELRLWVRCIVACMIALALLELIIAYVGKEATTQPLREWYQDAVGCVVLWFIFGPAWSLVFSWRRAG